MKLDTSKPVQTRDGRAARIICANRVSEHYPIIALVTEKNFERMIAYTSEGNELQDIKGDTDLVNRKEEQTYWVNFYDNGLLPVLHRDRESADEGATRNRVACVEITFAYTPGEGLCQ